MTTSFDFGTVAATYAAYRPHYPAALVDALAAAAPGRALAWDAGCGNGQLSVALATRFARVIATDPSSAQLDEAVAAPHVEYRRAAAEAGIVETGADLCVVAQAAHWFDWPRYTDAIRRVARPGALAATIAYGRMVVPGAEQAVIDAYYDGTVGPYWPPSRAHIENGYRDLPLPWPAVAAPELALVERWTRAETLGYIGTWSATNRYLAAHGAGALEALGHDVAATWPDDERRPVSWPLVIRFARVP